MATDLKGSYFKLLSVSLKVGHFSHVQGGTAHFLAGQHDLDFRSSRHLLSGFFSSSAFGSASRLSLSRARALAEMQEVIWCWQLLAESEGGAGRLQSRGGEEVTAGACLPFISFWCCRRMRGWHAWKGEPITWHVAAGTVNWACSSC